MRTIELNIQGYFTLTPCTLNTEIPLDSETTMGILDNLQQGEYLISIRDRIILDINDLSNPIYSFILEPTDSVEYEFEEVEG